METSFAPDFLPSILCVCERLPAESRERLQKLHALLRENFKQFEIIIVDNGAREEDAHVFLTLLDSLENIRYIRLAHRYSEEVGLTCALEQAIGDVGVTFDAAVDSPSSIFPLAKSALKGNIAIARARRRRGILRSVLARVFYRLLRKIGGIKTNLDEGRQRAYPRAAIISLNKIKNKRRSLRVFNTLIGVPQEIVDVGGGEGDGEESLPSAIRRGLDLLVSNFIHPLKWVSWLGCAAAFVNMLYLLYIIVVSLFKSKVAEGWISSSLTTTVMFLILFLVLAVIAEYIGRILEEVREQPLYFIEFEKDSRVDIREKIINVV
jgi:glycosyltransferase involved in cell wall biosynthesis